MIGVAGVELVGLLGTGWIERERAIVNGAAAEADRGTLEEAIAFAVGCMVAATARGIGVEIAGRASDLTPAELEELRAEWSRRMVEWYRMVEA